MSPIAIRGKAGNRSRPNWWVRRPVLADQVDKRTEQSGGTAIDVLQHGDVRRVTVPAPSGFHVDVTLTGLMTLNE